MRAKSLIAITICGTLLLGACGSSEDESAGSGVLSAGDVEVPPTSASPSSAEKQSDDSDQPVVPEAVTLTEGELAELTVDLGDALVEFSQCVRADGFEDFPDFNPDEITSTDSFIGALITSGYDLAQVGIQESMLDCGTVFEDIIARAPTPTDQDITERETEMLAFAGCMRSEGLTEFPDPDFSLGAGFQSFAGAEVDPDDPKFISANEACDAQGLGFLGSDE